MMTNEQQFADEQQSVEIPAETARIYDNEWVRFVNQLSKNEALSKIAVFAADSKFTYRAKRKLISYTYALLGRNLAVTYVQNEHDRNILYCEKAVIDPVLKLGLTTFDITPEFEVIVDLISLQFTIMTMQATGGFERKSINTNRTETSQDVSGLQQGDGGLISRFLGRQHAQIPQD